MARRRKMGPLPRTLLTVGGLGLAAYVAYRAGLVSAVANWLASLGGGSSGNGSNNGNGSGNGLTIDLSGIADAISGLFGGGNSNGTTNGSGLADLLATLGLGAGATAGGGASAAAGATLLDVAPALVPLWLGLSESAPKVVHAINVALPGENTGLEKGNTTWLSTGGDPFILTKAGDCYNLAGQKVPCPAAAGVEQHTLDWWGV